MRLHAAARERDVRPERPALEREVRLGSASCKLGVQRRSSAAGSADGATQATPDARHAPSVSKCERRAPLRQGVADRAQSPTRVDRNVAEERKRQMNVLAGDRAAPRAARDIARKRQELQPHRVVGHQREERAHRGRGFRSRSTGGNVSVGSVISYPTACERDGSHKIHARLCTPV